MTTYRIQPSAVLKPMLMCIIFLSAAALSRAQEVEGNGKGGGALFSTAGYIEASVPLTGSLGVNTYGFYLGNFKTGIALVELPLKVSKHLVITPSYLFIKVPASGLSMLTGEAKGASYQEHQFRQAATLTGSWRHLTIADRNMYARRFTANGDINRYRNKVYLAHEVSIGSYRCSPFAFDEVYHDFAPGKWLRRNWVAAGVDMPANRYVTFQVSYIRQDDNYLRSVNFLGVGLIIRTGKLLHRD